MSSTKVNYPIVGQCYDHYKGGSYTVISMATHTETDEKLVIYESILYGSVYARPLSVWFEEAEVDGEKVPRFQISELYHNSKIS